MEIANPAALANPVLMEETAVEPDRRVERSILVDAQPGELVVERLGVLGGGEVSLLFTPIGNRAADPVDQLTDTGLALVGADLAVEIFRHHDLGRKNRPARRDLDVFLAEDNIAGIVGDLGGAIVVPLKLVERGDLGRAEYAWDAEAFAGLPTRAASRRLAGATPTTLRRAAGCHLRLQYIFGLGIRLGNHDRGILLHTHRTSLLLVRNAPKKRFFGRKRRGSPPLLIALSAGFFLIEH